MATKKQQKVIEMKVYALRMPDEDLKLCKDAVASIRPRCSYNSWVHNTLMLEARRICEAARKKGKKRTAAVPAGTLVADTRATESA